MVTNAKNLISKIETLRILRPTQVRSNRKVSYKKEYGHTLVIAY